MSKPLKGLCSGNFVGDTELNFSVLESLASEMSLSRDGVSLVQGSGDIGGDSLPPRLMLSSSSLITSSPTLPTSISSSWLMLPL